MVRTKQNFGDNAKLFLFHPLPHSNTVVDRDACGTGEVGAVAPLPSANGGEGAR